MADLDDGCVQLAGAGSLAEVRSRIAAWLDEHAAMQRLGIGPEVDRVPFGVVD
jgi:hypothetical protein